MLINFLKNKFCRFLLWDKMIKSFTYYFLGLISVAILYHFLVVTKIGQFIFKKIDLNYSISYLSTPSEQNFLNAGPLNIIVIITSFAIFCYIFDLIRVNGLRKKYPKEEGKFISPIRYLLLISVIFSVIIIFSYFGGYFGEFTFFKNMEILLLILVLVFLLLSLQILKEVFPESYNDYYELLIFFHKKSTKKDLNDFSQDLFYVIVAITIFGLIFFDIISIIVLDLMLIFISGLIGTFINMPDGSSTIKLKSGSTIANVFILDYGNDFITYLMNTNEKRKVTIDSVETISNDRMTVDFDKNEPIRSLENYRISNTQDKEINENCVYISKISNVFIIKASTYSIFMGVCFYLIFNFFKIFGLSINFLKFSSIPIIIITILLALLIFDLYRTLKEPKLYAI